MSSRKVLFIAVLMGPDGKEYTSRILTYDRRSARRIATSGASLTGSTVVAVDTDVASMIERG